MVLAIGKGDLEEIVQGYARALVDTVTVDETGTTTTTFYVKDALWQSNMLIGYKVHFLTGELAGVFYDIDDNGTDYVECSPDQGITPEDGDKFAIVNFQNAGASAANIEQWGGTALTGADITGNIQHLDLDITTLRDALLGVGVRDFTDIYTALTQSPVETLADGIDISGGVDYEAPYENYWRNSSLYISVTGQIDITLEFAPESGDFYEPADSPLVFAGAGDDIYEIGYTWKAIQLTGSNANNVTAKLKGLT